MKNEQINNLFQDKKYNECLILIGSISKKEWTKGILELKAFSQQKLGDYEEAMITWSNLIQNFGHNPTFYENRGICKSYLGFKSSLEDMNKAVELDTENGYRYACRGFIKDKLGDTEGSIIDFKKSLELDPDNEVTWNNLGLAQEKLGYKNHAKMSYQKSDSLLGIEKQMAKFYKNKTNDTTSKEIVEDSKSTILQEMKNIVSSKKGFYTFIKEIKAILFK